MFRWDDGYVVRFIRRGKVGLGVSGVWRRGIILGVFSGVGIF